jgi:glycosyltransferase involved in cell wall biosynthesis
MVSFFFHPDYSGSAVQAHNLSKQLVARGMAPSILTANLRQCPPFEIIDGIPVHRVDVRPGGDLQIPSFWWSSARFLWKKRHEFDIVHAHGTLQHASVSVVAGLLRKPSILKVAMADSDLAFERQGKLNGSLNKVMVGRFDKFIATTGAIAKEMRDKGLDADKIELIPNGVDSEVFFPVEDEERRASKHRLDLPDEPLVTCVAIVNERKNIDGMLRIWRDVVASGRRGHLAIVGPVPESAAAFAQRLHAFVAEHGLGDRVSFLGQKAPVVPYLQASDLFLFPSRQEGMPNAVLEAMACGLPCLVSRSAGTEEIVTDGVDGWIFDPDDEKGFAQRLVELLSNADLRPPFARRARATILNRYSLSSVADRYRSLYRQLLQRS